MDASILAKIGTAIAWIFAPLGWTKAGNGWKMAVAAVSGLIAKRKRCCYLWYALWICRSCRRWFRSMGQSGAGDDTNRRLRLSGIQPSLCTMFRSNGCYQERDEQSKVVLVCNRISVYTCLHCSNVHLPIGTLFTAGVFGFGTVVAFIFCDRLYLSALPQG